MFITASILVAAASFFVYTTSLTTDPRTSHYTALTIIPLTICFLIISILTYLIA